MTIFYISAHTSDLGSQNITGSFYIRLSGGLSTTIVRDENAFKSDQVLDETDRGLERIMLNTNENRRLNLITFNANNSGAWTGFLSFFDKKLINFEIKKGFWTFTCNNNI